MSTIFDLMNNPWGFMDDIFSGGSRAFRNVRNRAAGKYPPVNVYMDENAVLVDVELPGKTAADIELSLEPQAVTISGKAAEEPAAEGEVKVTKGAKPAWSRRLELPFRVDADKANAKFADGILRIELPKVAEQAVRKLSIA